MIDDLAVQVDRPLQGHPSASVPPGRVCEVCTTRLSRYNPTPWCSVHEHEVRRIRNLFGGFPHGSVLRDIESPSSERPLFRCDGCDRAWPISYQWLTAHHRFCAWCRPVTAVRSDALELAS